jgi:hypothetical protein
MAVSNFRLRVFGGAGGPGSASANAAGTTYTVSGLKPGSTALLYGNGSQIATTTADGTGKATWTLGSAPVAGTTITYDGTYTGSGGTVAAPAPAQLSISGANGTATVGDTTSFTPTISGGTTPYTVTATGLPPGRSIANAATGLTTGAYTTAGSYGATYNVADSSSPQQTASFTRTVTVNAASTYLPATATAPTGIFGLNRLVSTYSGPAVRVVRASDSAEQDIGFSGNTLDTASALTFQGASTLTIRTVYDQSGNANHLIQATASLRPTLYLGEGGPSITAFSGKSLAIPATLTGDRQNVSVFEVARMPSQGVAAGIWEFYDTGANAIDLALRSASSSYAMQPIYGSTSPAASPINYQGFNVANTSVYGLVTTSSGTTVHRDEIAVSYPAVTSKTMATGGQILRTTAIDGKFDLLAWVFYPAAVSSTETTNIKNALRDIHAAALPATLGVILQGDSITFGTGTVNNRNVASQLALTLGRSAMVRNLGIAGSQASVQTGMWDTLPTRFTVPGAPNVLRYHLGKNDITNGASASTTITSIVTTIKAARNNGTAGLIVAVPALPDGRASWTSDQETQRLLLNAWMRSDPRDDTGARLFDAIDDLAMDSVIGDAATLAGGGAKDITLYPDNLHPSELAIRTRMAPSFTAAVQFLAPAGHTVTILTTVAAPVNTTLPAISGTPQVGQVLSVSAGSWSNTSNSGTFTRLPARYRYQWKLNGTAVSGADRSNYTAAAADAGKVPTCDVTVSNAAGSVTVTTVYNTAIAAASSALAIAGTPVNSATVNQAYAGFTATATGGTTPYTYSVASGSLPSGITLNPSTGAVSGTPTATGTFSGIVIRVTDSAATPATADLAAFSITVSAAVQQLAISGTPEAATSGQAYSFTPTATGGTGSYTFSLVSGSLPSGLSFSTSNGAITGTPTATGTFPIVIRVTDTQSSTADLSASIAVAAAAGAGIVVEDTRDSFSPSDVAAFNATLPATINTNDLLIACVAMDGNSTLTWDNTTAGAWTQTFNDVQAANRLMIFTRKADGTEDGKVLALAISAAQQLVVRVFRLSGATGEVTVTGIGNRLASGATYDPPAVTASWGAANNFFLAIAGIDNATSITGGPSSYSSPNTLITSSSGQAAISTAYKIVNAASDDPGVFTSSTAVPWVGATLVARPA